ncbi:unnamed protein product [Agarophyton chilense]|eukprot:gb/GEZJ01003232.1/.p1 GENE.gb/GEZJ01003232.1/~~gb/GEZJ01003232.1/.p1  ORF type:complete len:933 (-),score=150.62 gb/GEZJ01003232.1/:1263-4061(-)
MSETVPNVPLHMADDVQPSKKRGPLFRISYAIDRFMRTCFFRLGYLVAARPLWTILLSIALLLVSLIGMLRFTTESRGDKLWVPQGTVALANQQYVESRYGQPFRRATIAFVARDGRGLANKPSLLEALAVAETGWKVTAPPSTADGADNTIITWPERCVTTTDTEGNDVCRFSSALALFYDPKQVVKNDDGSTDFFATVRRGIQQSSDEDIKNTFANPSSTDGVGLPFNSEELINGASGSGSDFDFKIMTFAQLIENRQVEKDGDRVDAEADDLEEAWTNLLLDDTPLLNDRTLDWYVESQYSQEESLSQALNGDLPLLSAGFVLLAIYVIFFLGDFHVVRSHMWLAVGALITTGLALGVCFGLSSAFGMFYGPVHQILPLLLIGIGIDDCFHVTRAYDDINLRPGSSEKPVRMRIALALSAAGTAITVTSFTNVVVFLLSAISRLPALRFFALWAAIGIFFAWVFSITFFAALLTLDARRQEAKRRDCCPFFPPVAEVRQLNWFKKKPAGFSRFFTNWFGPFIMRPTVRAILLVLFLGWLAACCYGVSQLYLKFQFSFFYPDGSAQREFQDQIDKYFFLGDRTKVYVRDRDLSTIENQRRLLRLCGGDGVIANNRWIQKDTVDCWYPKLLQFSNAPDGSFIRPEAFENELKQFLEGSGGRYESDVLFSKDSSRVIGCKFSAQYVYRETNDDEIKALKSVRESADSVGFGDEDGNAAAFPYSFFDTFTEQYDALPAEIGLSLGLASMAVALVCFLLVGHPVVAIVSVVVVGIIIIDVLGLTFFSGVNLNSVSVITLVLCTGIAVDFVVHIARAFLEQVGTRSERAIKALGAMGPPVFYAGFSTLLAIIMLAGASSYIFQVIFRGFLFLILMGFVHGLVLGPMLLSLVGPRSFYADEGEKEMAEMQLEERVMDDAAAMSDDDMKVMDADESA